MKVNTKTVHCVDYGDLEKKIQEVYGYTYEMACDIESGNDTSHEFDGITIEEARRQLLGDEGMAPYNRKDLEEWHASNGRKQMWGPRLMMLDMVLRGLIPEGDYVVSISW